MEIGSDIDFTLIDYSLPMRRFAHAADIKLDGSENLKETLKRYLKAKGEEDWLGFQAWLFSEGLSLSKPYYGALEFIRLAQAKGHKFVLCSHKTSYSYGKPRVALRKFMHEHLSDLFARYNLYGVEVHFFEGKAEKIDYVKSRNFAYFLDDLCEVIEQLDHHKAVLFDPRKLSQNKNLNTVFSWHEYAKKCQLVS
jgi:hypothetical protein